MKTPYLNSAILYLKNLRKELLEIEEERERYIEHAGKELDRVFEEFVKEAFSMWEDDEGFIVAYLGSHCLGRIPVKDLIKGE
jgi:hypothetical protein